MNLRTSLSNNLVDFSRKSKILEKLNIAILDISQQNKEFFI